MATKKHTRESDAGATRRRSIGAIGVNLGETTRRLADADDVGPRTRAAIREALEPKVEQLRHDLGLVALALTGPDPEFALYELVQVLGELPGSLRGLERTLSRRVRAA